MIISRKIPKQILTAGIGLSITFAVSCGEHDLGELYISSSGTEISSSGGSNVSSSSVSNSSAWISCGSRTETFDPDLYECRAGDKIYLKTPVSYKGDTYDAVLIGAHTWMAKNLNYNAKNSKCYEDKEDNCNKYGRLYDWTTAMGLSYMCSVLLCESLISAEQHRGICPEGWHLPSHQEWVTLTVSGNPEVITLIDLAESGTRLKAASGWKLWDGISVGTDDYGFAALPSGNGGLNSSSFSNAGYRGYWWTSSAEHKARYAQAWHINYNYEYAYYDIYNKSYLFSVRCVKDY